MKNQTKKPDYANKLHREVNIILGTHKIIKIHNTDKIRHIFEGESDQGVNALIHKIHDDMSFITPNDWIYSAITGLLDSILEYNPKNFTQFKDWQSEIANREIDIYTHELLMWLAENPCFLDEYDNFISEGLISLTVPFSDIITQGQGLILDKIAGELFDWLNEQIETSDQTLNT